jgi:CBS-domain-containing membrane protein
MEKKRNRDLMIAPLGEAFLLLVAALVGWVLHQPLVFASLGPTAYELVETPHRRSAQPYSVFVGHLVAVAAGFAAIFIAGCWHTPPVSHAGVPFHRIWAAVIAVSFTVFVNLLLRASQPAALSTALLVSLGIMQSPPDAAILMGGVVLMILLGEPIRLWRLRHQEMRTAAES